jgi:hypothetical protein
VTPVETTVQRAQRLREKLEAHLSPRASDTLVTDLVDIAEVCEWTFHRIDTLSKKSLDREALELVLVEFEVELIFHLRYHLNSLARQLPRALKEISIATVEKPKRRVKKAM